MSEWLLRELELMLLLTLLIFGAVLISKWLGRKIGYRWRKLLWLLIAISLVIPVAFIEEAVSNWTSSQEVVREEVQGLVIPIAVPEWNVEEQVIVLGDEAVVNASKLEAAVIQEKNIIVELRRFFVMHGAQVAGLIWGIGAVFLLGFGGVQYFTLRRKYLKEAEICGDECIIRFWKEACQGQRKLPKVLIHSELSSPMLFGYFHTVLLLPETNYSEQELAMMFRHEGMHYRQKDLWYKLLLAIVSDIYWFNPAFRYMKRKAFQDVEYVCDELVTRDMNREERYSYGQIILKTMTRTWGGTTAYTTQFAAGMKTAKTRLWLLFTGKNRKIGVLVVAILVLLAVGVGSQVSFAWQEEQPEEEIDQTETMLVVESNVSEEVEAVNDEAAENAIVQSFTGVADYGKKYFRWLNMCMTYLTEWTRATAYLEDGSKVSFTEELDFSLTLETGGSWRAELDMPHEEYCDMIMDNYLDFTLEEVSDVTVAGKPARKLVFTQREQEDTIYLTQQYSIVYDLVMYDLTFWYPVEKREEYAQVVEDTLASIEFYEQEEYVPNTMGDYQVMLGDFVYYCTGESEVMGDAGNVEGYIEEYVPLDEDILKNGQANFEAVGSPYTYDWGNGTRAVLIGDEYYRFEMCEEDYMALIAGNWTLDVQKTEEELYNYGLTLQELYGTGLTTGTVVISTNGDFYYAYGIGIGGDGCCSYDDGMITATILPYENHTSEMYETTKWARRYEDNTEYLVQRLDTGYLYFVRENEQGE